MATVDIHAAVSGAAAEENNGKKWMKYKTDSGKTYAVFINEAVGKALAFDDIGDNETLEPKPQTLKLRVVNAVSPNGKVKVSYPVGKPTAPIYKDGGVIKIPRLGKAAALELAVTSVTGESQRKVTGRDSGQNLGDAA